MRHPELDIERSPVCIRISIISSGSGLLQRYRVQEDNTFWNELGSVLVERTVRDSSLRLYRNATQSTLSTLCQEVAWRNAIRLLRRP